MLMLIGDLFVLMTAIPAILFPIMYWRLADWRSSHLGRHLMSFMVACGVILFITSLTVIFGQNYEYRPWIRMFVFGALAYLFWRRLYLLIMVQRHPERYAPSYDDDTREGTLHEFPQRAKRWWHVKWK